MLRFTEFLLESTESEITDWITTRGGHRVGLDREGRAVTTSGGSIPKGQQFSKSYPAKIKNTVLDMLDSLIDYQSKRKDFDEDVNKSHIKLEDSFVDSLKTAEELKKSIREYNTEKDSSEPTRPANLPSSASDAQKDAHKEAMKKYDNDVENRKTTLETHKKNAEDTVKELNKQRDEIISHLNEMEKEAHITGKQRKEILKAHDEKNKQVLEKANEILTQ